jgi:hypothetical protein
MYEGEVLFEHCNALDQGPANATAKKSCWHDWLQSYTYGQSRDRVEYAATRLSELSLDPTLPSEDRDVRRNHSNASPMPTNAFAPPPGTAEHAGVPEPPASEAPVAAARPPVAPNPPGGECAEGCSEYWKTCRAGCKAAACEACDHAYKLCVPGCFKK